MFISTSVDFIGMLQDKVNVSYKTCISELARLQRLSFPATLSIIRC